MSRDVFCLIRSAQRLPAKLSLATSSPARRNARSVEIRRLPTGEQGVPNPSTVIELHLLWPVQDFQPEFLDPISFSLPQGSAHSAGPAQKKLKLWLFHTFGRFLGLPKNDLNFVFKKLAKKCKNHGFGGPQTPPKRPKILPKSRSPKSDDFSPKLLKKLKNLKTLTLDFVAMASVS